LASEVVVGKCTHTPVFAAAKNLVLKVIKYTKLLNYLRSFALNALNKELRTSPQPLSLRRGNLKGRFYILDSKKKS
jgi:hypothetical protein